MNESEYYISEFTDVDLDAKADAGEYYPKDSGFYDTRCRLKRRLRK